jgi:hypothetical protein
VFRPQVFGLLGAGILVAVGLMLRWCCCRPAPAAFPLIEIKRGLGKPRSNKKMIVPSN